MNSLLVTSDNLNCDHYISENVMDSLKYRLPPNPMVKANPISKLLFLWIFPLFWKGYKRELCIEDLSVPLTEDESEVVCNNLERCWQMEIERSNLTGKNPSLARVLITVSRKTLIFVSFWYIVNQCIIFVLQPIILRLLIETFDDHSAEKWKGYTYAGVLSVLVYLNTLTIHPGIFQTKHLAMKLRVGLSAMIYRKTLRLSKTARNQTSSGQIVNLLSNDVTRFDTYINYLPYIASAPIQAFIFMYILYGQIGPASFAGAGFIFLLLPMQYYLGKYSAIFRQQIAKMTDERGGYINEIIIGIRIIKQYAWEKPFSALIERIRKLEIIELRKRGVLRGLHHALFTFAPQLLQYLTFLIFVLIEDEPMSAEKVFFTNTCLHSMLRVTVSILPQAAAGIGEMLVSIERLQEFLMLEEQTTNNEIVPFNASNDKLKEVLPVNLIKESTKVYKEKHLSMKTVSARWTDSTDVLKDVSFSVNGDMLVMIVGPVGSSKTSLLHTILDELCITYGKMNISGSISYASQEPWIFPGNLRQNILFGLPYDEFRYNETLSVCALDADMKQLPYGDMTLVGERGVALSGGQKARVNLARAVYRKSDIYLLDDPLSAVDTRVSRYLFNKCAKDYLSGSMRILVTHQLQYLPQADYIIVLDQGKILAKGKFQDLLDSGIHFSGLTARRGSSCDSVVADKRGSAISIHSIVNNSPLVDGQNPVEKAETKAAGSVSGKSYREYFMAGQTVWGFGSLILLFILCQLAASSNDYWLSFWTNAEQNRVELESNITSCPSIDDKACNDTYLGENTYLYVYSSLTISVILLNLLRGTWFYIYCAKISKNVHNAMLQSVLRAPTKFFDDNPSGRIMNRFTRDVGTMDELLPVAFIEATATFLQVIGVITVVIISNYYMSVPAVFLFVALYYLRVVFIKTARDVKRIESIARSPLYTHVASTVEGLTTIRACQSQDVLIKQFEKLQDIHSSSWFLFLTANRGFGIWLELISDTFLVLVAFSFLIITTSVEGGNVGLAISSLLTLMGNFQHGMRQSAETENFMTSVERALEYSKISPEADLNSKPKDRPSKTWPDMGHVEFRNVSLSYQEGEAVLRDLSFKVRPSEKIGIVGRTGAGKSSIIAALFRMTEPEGQIFIDNVAVNMIGLHDLRKNISIIPQDPMLFSGTIRYNLDPFGQFEDHHMWKVIEEVELKHCVPTLDYKVADGGTNFLSLGQRQLVCLARAILRKNRILVMDEATANVDPATDQLIQKTIRKNFSDCTVITIAHRLDSIIDCDRVLVLDFGELKQYDHPHVLLQDDHGIFSRMVAHTGQHSSETLRNLSAEAFRKGTATTMIHQD